MRSAFENGWPFTSAVDIFANSPALPLNRNTKTESAGRSAAAPVSAPYAAQANAAHPAHSKIVRTRLMIVAPLLAAIGGWFLRRGGRHLQRARLDTRRLRISLRSLSQGSAVAHLASFCSP